MFTVKRHPKLERVESCGYIQFYVHLATPDVTEQPLVLTCAEGDGLGDSVFLVTFETSDLQAPVTQLFVGPVSPDERVNVTLF